MVFPGFCCCDVVVCGFVVGFVYLCGRCLRPCAFCGVGLWVVVLFENSIVCHVFYAMGPGGLRVLCGFLGLVLFWFAWLLLWGLGGAMWSGFLGFF